MSGPLAYQELILLIEGTSCFFVFTGANFEVRPSRFPTHNLTHNRKPSGGTGGANRSGDLLIME